MFRKRDTTVIPRFDNLADAFWFHIVKGETEDDCWERVNNKGYGQFVFDGKRYQDTHLSYEMFNGSIPEGMLVCHSCDNPPCCNHRHLFAGTNKENMEDMARKGRGRKPASYYKNRADLSLYD